MAQKYTSRMDVLTFILSNVSCENTFFFQLLTSVQDDKYNHQLFLGPKSRCNSLTTLSQFVLTLDDQLELLGLRDWWANYSESQDKPFSLQIQLFESI